MTYCGKKRRRRRIPPPKDGALYRQIWRLVDGAVLDCFSRHPNYVEARMARAVRMSIVKRVTGSIVGFVGLPAGSASGDVSGADNGEALLTPRSGGGSSPSAEGGALMRPPFFRPARRRDGTRPEWQKVAHG